MTHKSFTVIISFTKRVKAVIKVKTDRYGLECVENKFLKLPNVQKYEVVKRTEDGFVASVEMDDGYEFLLNACVVNQVFPSTVMYQSVLPQYVSRMKWGILIMQEIAGL